ncbi:DinB family protein [Pseudonocardia acaciae]|uniref:DinB family protein n=1 Tax=Pseudonocardia acaciae TaxID=551276 RepID=UPI000490680D|nr:DinB family protein [Pseudonocardia acaciae]
MGNDPVPPLAAEDHVCAGCGVDYAALDLAEAERLIAEVPGRLRDRLGGVEESRYRRRPRPDTWSAVEYLCHLRDLYATSTIRLHRVRTEDRPVFEPMLNDLRARRFRYNERDPDTVLDELAANVAGFREEMAKVSGDGWDRTGSRRADETRTARWIVRQAAHEGVHHARDIDAVLS